MNRPYSAADADVRPNADSLSAMVVDDHPLFCDALELTLKSLAEYATVHTADCLEAALELLDREAKPDLILLDLNLPDVTGLDGLMRLKRQCPKARIIVASSMMDNSIITGAIAAGASGFVPKHSHRSVFREAIDQINAGTIFTPKGFVAEANVKKADDAICGWHP
ncbi:MAG: response regulator [Pikeienuella sp.]